MRDKTISATNAARSFSEVLDQVQFRDTSFSIAPEEPDPAQHLDRLAGEGGIVGFRLFTLGGPADPLAPTFAKPVKILSVHDGDTFHATVDLGYGLAYTPKGGIRAARFDAWEVNKVRRTVAVTDAEIVKGQAARDDLAALFAANEVFIEDDGKTDPHGRLSAVIWVRQPQGTWVYVAAWMEAKGHLRTAR